MRILFVCIGNTCRSPMAEAVMKHWIRKNNLDWTVDSAGLRDWNEGRSPESRCIKVLKENNLTIHHTGRKIKPEDFEKFDYILAMDESNIDELNELFIAVCPKPPGSKVELLGSYHEREEDRIIRDPYFTQGMTSFRSCFEQINKSCENFIKSHMQGQCK